MTVANFKPEVNQSEDLIYEHIRNLESAVLAVSQLSSLLEDTDDGKILLSVASELTRSFRHVYSDVVRSMPS